MVAKDADSVETVPISSGAAVLLNLHSENHNLNHTTSGHL